MYHITLRPVAAQEYEDAIKWYVERSTLASEKFVEAVNNLLDNISRNPQRYRNLFKNYHEASTRKYPYSIVYIIDEAHRKIVIVAVYHHKRNPKKKYRK
jgi:plasmid stabilization system protein ParE